MQLNNKLNGVSMSTSEVFIVSAARTAIGSFGGTLKDISLSQLATTAVQAVLQRSGCAPDRVGSVVLGTVIPTDPRDAYLSRVAAIQAGIPNETPAFNVNRLCGSGLQAIISAAQGLFLGEKRSRSCRRCRVYESWALHTSERAMGWASGRHAGCGLHAGYFA
nr:hypothetical protein GCM10020185_00410 [Pseudomonas brassicacearum subsp. brassicacearum]